MAVVIGLFNSMTALLCLDASSHMAEELAAPTKAMPKIIIWTMASQFMAGLVWILVLGFCATDLDTVISTSTGSVATCSRVSQY